VANSARVRTSRPRRGPSTTLMLQALSWALLVLYLIGLARHGPDFEPLVDGWLGVLVVAMPAVICWLAVPGADARRREVIALAAGLTAFATGNLIFITNFAGSSDKGFPNVADVGFVAFYPLALTAIALAVRRELHSGGAAVWLDSVLGGLGAAAVLAVVLDRVFRQVNDQSLADGVALFYPICDLLLLAAVIGTVARQGRRTQPYWLLLVAGLLFWACVDTLSALALADESYAVGGTLDVMWPTGMLLMAHWAVARPVARPRAEQPAALVMPGIATAAGLVVLVASGRIEVSTVAVVLATLTLIATAARTQIAFAQLGRLADLRRQASTDELTGLPNRRAFYARAEARLTSTPDQIQGLLLLDLDRFKEVNDSLGHLVGDQLLIEIGFRLTRALRDDDLLARLGGDEFAVLLADSTPERAVSVAEKLRAVVAEPCTLEGIQLRTDVSIGMSFAPEHGIELSVLLRRADIAMYQAKRAREGHRIYSDLDDGGGAGRLRAIQELHTALAEDQMTLHYQPKLDLRTNQVHDVEALVRWDHPTRGLLYPDSFLSLVEDAGLMHAMTDVVLRQALDQAATWQRNGRTLTIAVNLSPSSLVDNDLPAQIGALVEARGLPASALQLEITEEFLMADRDRTRGILEELRERGFQIAVDDFGTGYSSLAYLRELPIDELKLDRSFVFPMADDARAAALVFSTIGLAHSLGLRMVAEGVESRAALIELARHGCDQAQGYHISRAIPVAELDLWLEERERGLEPTAAPEPVEDIAHHVI
jgi:diguanylate cyclase (GGDEF)-like protein